MPLVPLEPDSGPGPDANSEGSKITDGLRRRVQRHSPHRLLRQKLVLPGGITISAEKHGGRLVVRVEMPEDRR
jgi:hypothetical protein